MVSTITLFQACRFVKFPGCNTNPSDRTQLMAHLDWGICSFLLLGKSPKLVGFLWQIPMVQSVKLVDSRCPKYPDFSQRPSYFEDPKNTTASYRFKRPLPGRRVTLILRVLVHNFSLKKIKPPYPNLPWFWGSPSPDSFAPKKNRRSKCPAVVLNGDSTWKKSGNVP